MRKWDHIQRRLVTKENTGSWGILCPHCKRKQGLLTLHHTKPQESDTPFATEDCIQRQIFELGAGGGYVLSRIVYWASEPEPYWAIRCDKCDYTVIGASINPRAHLRKNASWSKVEENRERGLRTSLAILLDCWKEGYSEDPYDSQWDRELCKKIPPSEMRGTGWENWDEILKRLETPKRVEQFVENKFPPLQSWGAEDPNRPVHVALMKEREQS